MSPSILGGALLPHAPQFFTMPETEDVKTVTTSPQSHRRYPMFSFCSGLFHCDRIMMRFR